MSIPALTSVVPRFSKENFMTFCRVVMSLPEVNAKPEHVDFLTVRWRSANSVGIKKADVKIWLSDTQYILDTVAGLTPEQRAIYEFHVAFYNAALK